jgi:KaiC/GvpD/RAD55 family RecA-like ATPase
MELITNISEIFWCSYKREYGQKLCPKRETLECRNPQCNGNPILNDFEPASVKGNQISWFDLLFKNGIEIQENERLEKRPITMLITGPPGSGKSTLALELCYQLASSQEQLIPLYISFESTIKSLVQKADKFGWNIKDKILPYEGDHEDFIKKIKARANVNEGTIAFWDKDVSKKKFEEKLDSLSLSFQVISDIISHVSKDLVNVKDYLPFLTRIYNNLIQRGINDIHPNVIVIDSLNIVSTEDEKRKIFENIGDNLTNTDLIICILDSINTQHTDWEYKADIILRLDYNSNSDYFLRTIEIVKARNQEHTLGKHQLKIHSRSEDNSDVDLNYCDKNIINHRSHPYRKIGGITIYPSIHYYLSSYRKRSSPTATEKSTESPFQIGEILNLPIGRCTAFIGDRGTHKSHAAYMHLLYNIIKDGYRGLIITLREDEKKTLETLQIILDQIIAQNKDLVNTHTNIYDYIHENRLEILYFLPGYITPNEFFHRIFISTHRMKQNRNEKVISVFNSLDQVEPRFPLCTEEVIFIPSIIEFFLGEHVTNIFIAVNDAGTTLDKYGLLPMADYILLFKKAKIEYKNFKKIFEENEMLKDYFTGHHNLQESIETVQVEINRHAGGRPNIITGYLELASSKNNYFNQSGIYFSKPKLS